MEGALDNYLANDDNLNLDYNLPNPINMGDMVKCARGNPGLKDMGAANGSEPCQSSVGLHQSEGTGLKSMDANNCDGLHLNSAGPRNAAVGPGVMDSKGDYPPMLLGEAVKCAGPHHSTIRLCETGRPINNEHWSQAHVGHTLELIDATPFGKAGDIPNVEHTNLEMVIPDSQLPPVNVVVGINDGSLENQVAGDSEILAESRLWDVPIRVTEVIEIEGLSRSSHVPEIKNGITKRRRGRPRKNSVKD
ncbi:TetR/AcrR family transcriptional regulator [Sesbania bispinosa]|nr:TetR/AcrR family transcriptional regulator [Sesbania bispinosa]